MKRLCAIALLASSQASAEPAITVRTTYYQIAGTTADELKAQMKAKGPEGYWAYTRWWVRWTGDCRLSVEISYTYPEWTDQAKAPPALQAAWSRMIEKLKLHEEGHGQHGRNAAQEIETSHCAADPRAITRRWAEQDKVYDAETAHGLKQGVVLP